MIDTNELRRKVNSTDIVDHIELHANIKPFLSELIDLLEAARTAWKEADKACRDLTEKVIPNLRESLEAAEKTNREWLRANAPGGWIDNLRAEVIHIKEVEFPRKAQAVADGWRGKC